MPLTCSPETDFQKAIPVEFKHSGPELIYEGVSQRAANQAELKELRAKWPEEKQDYFDVSITLRAKFKDSRLVDFYVRRSNRTENGIAPRLAGRGESVVLWW